MPSQRLSAECKTNIETIGQIRNVFAHSIDDMAFSDPAVFALCGKHITPDVGHPGEPDDTPTKPRERFASITNLTISLLLAVAIHHTLQQQPASLYVGGK